MVDFNSSGSDWLNLEMLVFGIHKHICPLLHIFLSFWYFTVNKTWSFVLFLVLNVSEWEGAKRFLNHPSKNFTYIIYASKCRKSSPTVKTPKWTVLEQWAWKSQYHELSFSPGVFYLQSLEILQSKNQLTATSLVNVAITRSDPLLPSELS